MQTKTKTSKRVITSLLLMITIVLLTACGGKSFEGFYQGTTEQGQVYHMAIDRNKVKLLRAGQLTEHSYTIDKGKESTQLYADDESISFTIVVDNTDDLTHFSMAINEGGLPQTGSIVPPQVVNFTKIDKKESPIK